MSQESIQRLIAAMKALNLKCHSIASENEFTDIQKYQDIEYPFSNDNETLLASEIIEALLKLLEWCVAADLAEAKDVANAVSYFSQLDIQISDQHN
jgi:hypothetical protein